MGQRVETKVSNIRLAGLDILAQASRNLQHKSMLGVKVNEQVDGLEENCILSIVLLNVLGCFHSGLHHLGERLSDDLSNMAVLCDIVSNR
jgi:hypothetical protein